MDNNLKYKLSKNLAIGATGLVLAFNMLAYNFGKGMELASKAMPTEKTVKELYAELDKMETIQNAAMGVGGASSAYLLLGLGIPLVGYAIKKKALEKDVI
jgi:hypothetical protein